MINIPPIKQSTAINAEVIPELTRIWKVGQVLSATTQRGGEPLSNVLIRVGQHTLEAKTPVALQSGQDIKLLVKSLGDPQGDPQSNPLNSSVTGKLPLLSIVGVEAFMPNTKIPGTETLDPGKLIALKLRQFIAIQQSFSELKDLANNLLNRNASSEQLPAPLKNLLNTLQQTIPLNTNNISPAQLKQHFFDSGVFFESKILSQATITKTKENFNESLNRDFKFQLLSIKAELVKFVPTKEQLASQTLNDQQIETLQIFIKKSSDNLTENKLNYLLDKLVTQLPKSSLMQLSQLLMGHKIDVSASSQDQMHKIESLAKLLSITLQQAGGQQLLELKNQLQFRLMLLELNQQIDQSISKITSLQLQPLFQSTGREADNLVLLLFNLVFKDAHERFDIDFRIQQDNEKEDPAGESWTVTLSFNFNTLGKVQSKIHLLGNHVSNVFYAELSTTAEKIKPLLPLLESGLIKAGLIINNLAVENSLLDNRPFNNKKINLLDENA